MVNQALSEIIAENEYGYQNLLAAYAAGAVRLIKAIAREGIVTEINAGTCREVATERDLLNCHGTFYELPAENADGFAKIRPIASHSFRIQDYASYRGLLVMTGINPEEASGNKHVIVSGDGKAAVWAGAIDDLWKLGKPVGQGGPWVNTQVTAGKYSDPYLIGYYDKKIPTLSHQGENTVRITVEADPTGNGDFMKYEDFSVEAGKKLTYTFPEVFQARWIRFKADCDVVATARLEYR